MRTIPAKACGKYRAVIAGAISFRIIAACLAFGMGTASALAASGDTDGDGDVDIDDVNAWYNNFGAIGMPGEMVPGDANGDGRVDIEDLNGVRNGFGNAGPVPPLGDAYPFDGLADIQDLNLVRSHFGDEHLPAAVPEPATGVLSLATLTISILFYRNPRSRNLRHKLGTF